MANLEQETKTALEDYLAQNYTPEVLTKVVKVEVENPLTETNKVYEKDAKEALEQFLEENKRTQIVVVEQEGQSSNDCCCEDSDSEESKVFTFTYDIQNLYDIVHMRTSYFGRNVRNEQNVSQIDAVAVTLDEWDIFFRLCKEASAEVYSCVSSYSREVNKAFLFNALDNGKIEILFAKRERSFDFNLLNVLDTLIETAIIYYIIAKWFETIGLQKEYVLYWGYFEEELKKIEKNSRNTKMKTAKRRYRWL